MYADLYTLIWRATREKRSHPIALYKRNLFEIYKFFFLNSGLDRNTIFSLVCEEDYQEWSQNLVLILGDLGGWSVVSEIVYRVALQFRLLC